MRATLMTIGTLALSGCAATPAAVPAVAVSAKVPCRVPAGGDGVTPGAGQIGEAYGVGGLGLVTASRSWSDAGDPALAKVPLRGATLRSVMFQHTEVGLGGRAEAVATFTIPRQAEIFLEARSAVENEGWYQRVEEFHNVDFQFAATWDSPRSIISDIAMDRLSFSVLCPASGARRVARWTFALRDFAGRRSNVIPATVTCTGQPIPSAPPGMDAVEIDPGALAAGGSANVLVRFHGAAPPLQLFATSPLPGYDWPGVRIDKPQAEHRFKLGCRTDHAEESVLWQFAVRDSFGRQSEAVSRRIQCGGCR